MMLLQHILIYIVRRVTHARRNHFVSDYLNSYYLFVQSMLTPCLFAETRRQFVLVVLILVMFLLPMHVMLCHLFTTYPDILFSRSLSNKL
jgi:hypothetical protein